MMKKGLVVLMAAFLGLAGMVQADLVSHYTFDNTADNSVAGAPNGTVMGGAAYVAGQVGTGALSFDGSGQHVDTTTAGLPVNGNGLQSGTIALWMQTTNSSGKQALMGACNDGSTQAFDWNTTAGGGLEFYLRSANENIFQVNASISSAFDGLWHHIAITWAATTGDAGTGTAAIYLDGVAQSISIGSNDVSSDSTWGDWGYPTRIAVNGRGTPNWDPFTGSLDDVRVYNNALSAQEVAGLVPEPATMSLLVLGALGILARRKR